MPDDEDRFDAVRAAAELEAALGEELAADPVAEAVARAEARLAREADRELARRTRAVLLDLLAVLDDLERALAVARREAPGTPLLDGLELVQRNFLAVLARQGVTRLDALGAFFDPAQHEGASIVLAENAAEHNRVVAVLRAGYAIGDELLRPATVVIARAA